MIQSLAKLDDFSILKQYGLIILDECHHSAATTYVNVLEHLPAQYLYAFTATFIRSDHKEKVAQMYLGEIIAQVDEEALNAYRLFAKVLIPHYTSYIYLGEQPDSWPDLISDLCDNAKRNHQILNDIIDANKRENNIIVLSDRKSQLDFFFDNLKAITDHLYIMTGKNR